MIIQNDGSSFKWRLVYDHCYIGRMRANTILYAGQEKE